MPRLLPTAALAAAALAGRNDDGLRLALDSIYAPEASPWAVPAYRFDMVVAGARAGTISLRIGTTDRVVLYAGQVGFSVEPEFRGRHLAERAVRLLLPLAARHGLDPLWITCNPDNVASRRTIERLGAAYVETVDLAPDYDRYVSRGERHKLRFRLDLPVMAAPAPAPDSA